MKLPGSIADLTKKFDEWGVEFSSVTQEINTATSAGRMMLNILITFAQYEREVITERVRDKMSASRMKGMWMGGNVPMVEDVLILRNSSLKLKTVVDNAILLNYAVSSENISESIKIKREFGFYLKVNVGIFRRNKRRPEKQSHRRQL